MIRLIGFIVVAPLFAMAGVATMPVPLATPSLAEINYKSATIRYHFGDKTVTHEIQVGDKSLTTTASDQEKKFKRPLTADDLKWIQTKLAPLASSKEQVDSCPLTYVEFKVEGKDSNQDFTVCRDKKSKNSKLADEILAVLGFNQ